MKNLLFVILLTTTISLNAQVKKEEPFKTLFSNMGMSATHSVEQYKDGSIYIMFQNLEYKTISDIEMLKIGDDVESAILCYQEMLNVLSSENGTYTLTNGIEVYKGVSGIVIRSGNEPTDGWTIINKMQCKKGIKKLPNYK